MRWQFRLVASFALVAAVGCDNQPMEPSSDAELSGPQFSPENSPAQIREYELSWTFAPCGFDIVDFTGTARETFRTFPGIEEGKPYQSMYHWSLKMTGTGRNTGYKWLISENHYERHHFIYTPPDEGLEHEAFHFTAHMIGQGKAPNFRDHVTYQVVNNANGDRVAYIVHSDDQGSCD